MSTYHFSAFSESSLLAGTGDWNLGVGDTFTMPAAATTSFTVNDGDSSLSGDSRYNDRADDCWGQTASITDDQGREIGNGGQIYAESYFWVKDQWGNWYVMIEIEQEGGSGDFFTFYTGGGYNVPPAGAVLTVKSQCDVSGDWLKYGNMDAGEVTPPATASITGRLFNDADGDDTEWNADTNSWEEGVAGMTVTLFNSDDEVVATTTTNGYGTYKFENLPAGDYYVKFTKPDGTDFVKKDVGSWGSDSDADAEGATDVFRLDQGEAKCNIDAGVERAEPAIDAANDRITVMESEGAGDIETLNGGGTSILANDTVDGQPYAGAVVEVNGAVGAVGQWIDLDKGRVKINADGTVDFDANGDFEALNAGESEEVSVEYTIRDGAVASVVATFEGPNGLRAEAVVIEQNGDLVLTVTVLDGGDIGDIRGFFFDVADESLLHGLSVAGADVTDQKFKADKVYDLGNGANVKGALLREFGKFDGGVETGTQGIGRDDLRSTTFTLSHESESLTLDFLRGRDMALRLTSVGAEDGSRDGSLKLGATAVATTGGQLLDTATVTIEVQGEDEPAALDAVDDFYVVDETEGAGDSEGNVLDNDLDPFNDAITVLKVNGETANVGEWIDLAGGGRVRLTAEGEIDFDADGDFDALNDGESAFVDLTYTIAEVQAAPGAEHTLSFNDLARGAIVTNQFSSAGVTISSASASHPVMVFDSANPTGGDWDLKTSNLGKVLILSEDGHTWDPDDNASGGTFIFEFDQPAHLESMTFLDTEEPGAEIRFYDEAGELISTVAGPVTANGGQAVASFDVSGVARMEIELQGSGAIDNLTYSFAGGETVVAEDTATVTIRVDGIDGIDGDDGQSPPDAMDDAFVTNEKTAVSGNVLDNDSDPDGDPISVVAVEGGNVGEAFEVTTAKGYTGQVTLNADGSFSFTPDANFRALAQDEQDSFQLSYTIADDPAAAGKTNLLFVLDISNSTVGRTGDAQDAFDGVGVGDVNGDGLSDTVLDAEIAAVVNAITELLDAGVDPSTVDIGVVTFSGVVDASRFASFNYPDEDATTVGTWSLDEAALIDALTGIESGGWTNYEAGLKEAEDWLADHADAGEANKVFFLSDGRPVINKINGNDVLQTSANYGDEVSRIANDYGAEIHAIGIGGNSDLDYLNDIDNTGGAVQVLDASDLTVTLADIVVAPLTDTATITVTINGLNEPPVATDDRFDTTEDTVVTGNIVTGDNGAGVDSDPDGDEITLTSVSFGQIGVPAVIETNENGFEGTLTVFSDGSFIFEPDEDLVELLLGETETVTFDYTIADGFGGTDTANVTIVVNGRGQPPVATDNAAATDEGVTVTGNVITDDDGFGADSDPDGDALTVKRVILADGTSAVVGSPAEITFDSGKTGTLTVSADGSYSFTPSGDFDALLDGESESYALTYTVTDETDGDDTATLTITVNGAGTPPVAEDDGIVITETGSLVAPTGAFGEVTLNILGNDSDPDGATGTPSDLTIVSVNGAAPGTAFDVTSTDQRFTASVTVDAAGNVIFDAAATFGDLAQGETARLQFDYEVVDADGLTDTATVTIDILGEVGGGEVEALPSFNIFFMVDLSASATTEGVVTGLDADFFRGGNDDLNGDGAGGTQADAALLAVKEFQAALQASGIQGDVDFGLGTFAHSTGDALEFQLLTNGQDGFIFDLGDDMSAAFGQAQGLGDTAFFASAAAGANDFFDAAGATDPDAINLFYILSDGAVIVSGAQQSGQVTNPFGEITGLLQGLAPHTESLSIGSNGGASTLGVLLGAPATSSVFDREGLDQWALDEVNQLLTTPDNLFG